jgi:glyoxylase-like metal-dependent hydrolase (beta-lactamase superfamily II)
MKGHMIEGKPEFVAPGVRRIVAGNAGLMTGPGTNTYLLGDREVAVLDPGPVLAEHLHNILAAAAHVRWILVTHTHRDHSPLASELARATGGEVALTAVHTPGHASNCVCYHLESERLLFTGDHVLEGVSPVILAPDGDMAQYLRSLDKLDAFNFEHIAPGHGGLIGGGKKVIQMLRAHRLAREAKVLRCLEQRAAAGAASTLDGLTPDVYDDVAAERHSWAKFTLEAHLVKLAREGRVVEYGGQWRISRG